MTSANYENSGNSHENNANIENENNANIESNMTEAAPSPFIYREEAELSGEYVDITVFSKACRLTPHAFLWFLQQRGIRIGTAGQGTAVRLADARVALAFQDAQDKKPYSEQVPVFPPEDYEFDASSILPWPEAEAALAQAEKDRALAEEKKKQAEEAQKVEDPLGPLLIHPAPGNA